MTQSKQLKRNKVGILKTEDNRYAIIPPTHKGLVLSGGGSKGIAYIGMIRALDEEGKLKQLTHVSGASAGAMAASLLAIGMPVPNVEKLVSQLDPMKLIDRASFGLRAKGDRFRNMLDLIYMVQIKEHLAHNLQKPIPQELDKRYKVLTDKIALYEKSLGTQGLSITSVDDIIKLSQSAPDLDKLDKAFKNLSQQTVTDENKQQVSAQLTLGDLGKLRTLLPQESQHLIKHLSVGVTNQSKNSFERYSEQSTPQQPMAQVVQWSGSHPALFIPGINARGEHVADGGILDNMPEINELDREEVLCTKAETGSNYNERVARADQNTPIMLSGFKKALDNVVESAIGGTWLNSTASLLNREKVFYHLDNMLFINTGELTTTNMAPTHAQKEQAIQNGYDQTKALIASQSKIFDHPLMAVLYVGLEQLDDALLTAESNSDFFSAAGQAKKIMHLQHALVEDINAGDYSTVRDYLKQIEDVLVIDAKMEPEQKEKALALCHKQMNFLSDGKLLNYLNEKAPTQQPWVMRALNFLVTPIAWVLSSVHDFFTKEIIPTTPVKEHQHTVQTTPSSVRIKEELQKELEHHEDKTSQNDSEQPSFVKK